MAEHKFTTIAYEGGGPRQFVNTFVLMKDNWNDYGNTILFDLFHFDGEGQRSHFGYVKILQLSQTGSSKVEANTRLPKEFSDLGEACISLGQSEDYYTSLRSQFGTQGAITVLEALKDIAVMPGLAAGYETSAPFRNGMMRENGAERARRFALNWIKGEPAEFDPRFSFETRIGDGDVLTSAQFDFDGADPLPGRIVALIGRNAAGKTYFLSQLASDLAQIERMSAERKASKEDRFPDGRPAFSRVITISYSAFDRFRRPAISPYSSYIHSGIRDEKGRLSTAALVNSYDENRIRIRELDREQYWTECISNILSDAEGITKARLIAEIKSTEPSQLLDTLSSGQAILWHFVTALLSWIDDDTIVLFDEPETHLHPNAVASLFLVLTDILRKFDSYAVLATHSAVVLQEIPSSRVQHLRRTGGTTIAETLDIESFGESVTDLTRHVFKTVEVDSLYKNVLKKLARSMSAQEVLELFPQGLSISAQSYLLAQYEREQEL